MHDISDIFSKRLKQARTLRKLSMDQLCALMNGVVSKQAIHKYETGKMMPNEESLVALVEALGVDPDYLFRPFTFEVNSLDVSFRKKSSVGKKDISALKIQIQDEIERYIEIENILGKDKDKLEAIEGSNLSSEEQMIKSAQYIRERWELGKSPITNVQDLLESKGIKVILVETENDFDGLSGVINDSYAIVVLNKNQAFTERRRFTALHELAHLLFDTRFEANLVLSEKEHLCNVFANEMLLPSSVIKDTFDIGKKIPTASLKLIQETYGISIDAIMFKLKQLGIISESRYKGYNIQKNTNEKLRAFVMKSRFQESMTSRFESLVYTAISLELVTLSKAATLLNEPISNVRRKASVV